ncbi:MAG: cellulase family glycosylhydrolase [Opitutaceae bacterium]
MFPRIPSIGRRMAPALIAVLCATCPRPTVAAPPALHTSAGTLCDSAGAPVVLRGIDICSLEWTNAGDHLMASVGQAVDVWHARLVRLPIAQDRWAGRMPDDKSGPDLSDGGAAYRGVVDSVVARASASGCYVLVDLHWSDMGVWGSSLGQHKMPDDNSAIVWRDIAARYANNPAVLFDPYNEPHDVSWQVWRSGGTVAEGAASYHSPGMQGLVDVIRATGANNVIAVGGLAYAYDLSGVAKGYAISGQNIIYSCHIYPAQPSDWDSSVGAVARMAPVLIGEFGADATSDYARFIPRMIHWIDEHRYSSAAWCMHTEATPCLIANWKYDRTYWEGSYVFSWMTGGPAAPARLQAGGGSGRISLSWAAVPGASGYRVYRSAKPGHEADGAPLTASNGASYVDSPLADGATYYYRVAAVGPACDSGFSAEMGATVGVAGGFEAPQPAFAFAATVSPQTAAPNRPVAITASATDVGRAGGEGVMVVVAIHDALDKDVYQHEFPHQNISPGQTLSFSLSWSPPSAGSYHVCVGAFAEGWSPKYGWEEHCANIAVP